MLLRNWNYLPNFAMSFQNIVENWLFVKRRVFSVREELQILVEIFTPEIRPGVLFSAKKMPLQKAGMGQFGWKRLEKFTIL